MNDISHMRHSKNLLEQAAYWAAEASWFCGSNFEDAQAVYKELQATAPKWDAMKKAYAACLAINPDNPMAAAEGIKGLVDACTALAADIDDDSGDVLQFHRNIVDRIRDALAAVERQGE